MNSTKIAELIAIAAGLFIIYRLLKPATAAAAAASGVTIGAQNITPAGTLPGQPGYGWQYFSDGTAISPEGVYYYQGAKVYDPFAPFGGATVSA